MFNTVRGGRFLLLFSRKTSKPFIAWQNFWKTWRKNNAWPLVSINYKLGRPPKTKPGKWSKHTVPTMKIIKLRVFKCRVQDIIILFNSTLTNLKFLIWPYQQYLSLSFVGFNFWVWVTKLLWDCQFWLLAPKLNCKVAIGEHDGRDQSPHVDDEAEPGRNHLDPDGRHVRRDGLDGDGHLARAVPVGQCHHDEQCGQAKQGVEHRPVDRQRICNCLWLLKM